MSERGTVGNSSPLALSLPNPPLAPKLRGEVELQRMNGETGMRNLQDVQDAQDV